MSSTHILKARVSSGVKERVQSLAQAQLITESIWLRRLIAAALNASSTHSEATAKSDLQARSTDALTDTTQHATRRVCIRLRREDRLLLHERSLARGLAAATYVGVLVRAHLRHLAPLPKEELKALKRTVAELSLVGRNLNQLARAANEGQRVSVREEDLRAVLKACEALRRHFVALISKNIESWEVGHASSED